jgi:DNA invertase Pin-like site-specific DNA recombinase
MNAHEMARVYGYIRASTDKQIASPETQRQIIEEYARRLGRTVDHYFIDPAVSGKKSLFDRDAGKEMLAQLKSGDEVIVARLDRLSRSFVGFAKILEFWLKHKIKMHLCDMPGGVFDPDNPMSELLIGVLIIFANYERRLISSRTREGLQAHKQRGERYTRCAEYGWRWEKRLDSTSGKHVTVRVADEHERAIMAKCVELRASGWSLDRIRQHLDYDLKVRNRVGGRWAGSRIAYLIQQGLRLMAETESGSNHLLATVNEEEEYGDLEQEDESYDGD